MTESLNEIRSQQIDELLRQQDDVIQRLDQLDSSLIATIEAAIDRTPAQSGTESDLIPESGNSIVKNSCEDRTVSADRAAA